MIVYIYERLSQGLHQWRSPGPGTSINAAYYVSNGYLIFMPDIVYTTGYPGPSALKCVLPAVQAVVDKGFVDEKNIGIQGHSWGGYQIAYMVTQTNRFKAAEAGRRRRQYDQRLQRHSLGYWPAAPVPIRAYAIAHRRLALGIPDAVSGKLAAIPSR
jgi:dipeptidyl aminopeptidase/acylaminoacyl peptidase